MDRAVLGSWDRLGTGDQQDFPVQQLQQPWQGPLEVHRALVVLIVLITPCPDACRPKGTALVPAPGAVLCPPGQHGGREGARGGCPEARLRELRAPAAQPRNTDRGHGPAACGTGAGRGSGGARGRCARSEEPAPTARTQAQRERGGSPGAGSSRSPGGVRAPVGPERCRSVGTRAQGPAAPSSRGRRSRSERDFHFIPLCRCPRVLNFLPWCQPRTPRPPLSLC